MNSRLHPEVAPQTGSPAIPATPPAVPTAQAASRSRKLARRAAPDYSQRLRRVYQLGFLALNAWLGSQFYLWVRHFETLGRSTAVSRPPGVEGYLPIAGLINTK